MESTNLNIRLDAELKKQAEKLFAELGLNMTSAITIFLRSSVDYNGIPFEVKKTNRAAEMRDEKLLSLSAGLIEKNREAYEELAK